MTKTTVDFQAVKIGCEPVTRPGLHNRARSRLAGMMGHISTKARWIISAVIALMTPAVLIAESAAALIAEAMACFGNGSFMALAATANAFTMIP